MAHVSGETSVFVTKSNNFLTKPGIVELFVELFGVVWWMRTNSALQLVSLERPIRSGLDKLEVNGGSSVGRVVLSVLFPSLSLGPINDASRHNRT